jgi:hypothetical protein
MTDFSIQPFDRNELLTKLLNKEDNLTISEFDTISLGSIYEDNYLIIYWESIGENLAQPAFILKESIVNNFGDNNILRGGYQLANSTHNSLRHFALTKGEIINATLENPIWFSLIENGNSEQILANSLGAGDSTYSVNEFKYDVDYNFKNTWNKAKLWLGDKDKKIPYYDMDISSTGTKGYISITKM